MPQRTQGSHHIVIHADPKGRTGHFAISLVAPDGTAQTFGKYPRNQLKIAFGNTPAEIRDDSKYRREDGDFESEPIDLTPEQAAGLRDYLSQAQENPGSYHLRNDNCIDFVTGALKAADVDKEVADLFPEEQLRKMGAWYVPHGAGDEAISDRDERREAGTDPRYPEVDSGRHPDESPEEFLGAEGPASDTLIGSSGSDALAGPPPTAGATPLGDRARFLAEAAKPPEAIDRTLAKPTARWTEAEMRDVLASDLARRPGGVEHRAVNDRLRDWHALHYGTGPVAHDASGRMIDPPFKVPPPRTPEPAHDPAGRPIPDGARTIGRQIAHMGDAETLPGAVTTLQSALNRLSGNGPDPDGRDLPILKQDGDFGPRTRGALHRAIARHGAERVAEETGLARFADHVTRSRAGGTGPGDDLETVTETAFGPLLGDPARRPAKGSPTPWGLGVQMALNDLGHAKRPDWRPLKEDGRVGPRTEAGFRSLIDRAEDSDWRGALSANLGFLG